MTIPDNDLETYALAKFMELRIAMFLVVESGEAFLQVVVHLPRINFPIIVGQQNLIHGFQNNSKRGRLQ